MHLFRRHLEATLEVDLTPITRSRRSNSPEGGSHFLPSFQEDGVFLDSDELDELGGLLDVVGRQTKNLLILLSSETLRRMWVACEAEQFATEKAKTSKWRKGVCLQR